MVSSKVGRALCAMPFIGIVLLANNYMNPKPAFPDVKTIMDSASVQWTNILDGSKHSTFVHVAFFPIPKLNELLKLATVVFLPSTLGFRFGFDPVSAWQMMAFLHDCGTLYAILLIESTRQANRLTPSQL